MEYKNTTTITRDDFKTVTDNAFKKAIDGVSTKKQVYVAAILGKYTKDIEKVIFRKEI